MTFILMAFPPHLLCKYTTKDTGSQALLQFPLPLLKKFEKILYYYSDDKPLIYGGLLVLNQNHHNNEKPILLYTG